MFARHVLWWRNPQCIFIDLNKRSLVVQSICSNQAFPPVSLSSVACTAMWAPHVLNGKRTVNCPHCQQEIAVDYDVVLTDRVTPDGKIYPESVAGPNTSSTSQSAKKPESPRTQPPSESPRTQPPEPTPSPEDPHAHVTSHPSGPPDSFIGYKMDGKFWECLACGKQTDREFFIWQHICGKEECQIDPKVEAAVHACKDGEHDERRK